MTVDLTSDADSDDGDMFLMGGPVKPISMYSSQFTEKNGVAISDGEDDDDDDDDDVVAVPLNQGHTKKRGRGRPPKRPREDGASSARSPKIPKKAKESVFEISSDDDDVQEVTPLDSGPRRDSFDAETAAQLANARRLLENEANESRILAEAEEQAKLEVERAERMRQEEKRQKLAEAARLRMEKEKAKAAATAEPIRLKVRSGKNEVKMRIRRSDPVRRMLGPFCKKFSLDEAASRMEFDGEEITEKETPDSLELEDDMVIDVYVRPSR